MPRFGHFPILKMTFGNLRFNYLSNTKKNIYRLKAYNFRIAITKNNFLSFLYLGLHDLGHVTPSQKFLYLSEIKMYY